MFPEITLTIAMTPGDFVWQGFMRGKRDGCKEWPAEGESLFSYRGKPLLIGAEDDVLWDTAKYVRCLERRLAEKPHSCNPEAVVYAHVLYSKACKKQLRSKFSSALCFWRCVSCFWTVQASEGRDGGTSSRSGQTMNI